jgi:Adenylate and Guanylate cyclase catalytic domain
VDLYFPIINNISRVDESTITPNPTINDTIGALIAVSIYWRNLIRDILPPGSNGIVVVVECPCNEVFSYQINGSNVNYVGVGDAHDIKYNHLAKTSKLVNLNTLSLRESIYSGPPLDDSYCPYTLHLYPSDTMKSDFTTRNGVIFMVSTICIFIFTSLVFYLYDWKVERRQNRVVFTARRSSALLSSLFPATVRDQLYQVQTENNNVKAHTWNFPVPFVDSLDSNTHFADKSDASPIAQLYTDTTVIFMDIVGFTHWSSTREPAAVFQLLETLYGKFDSLAKVHGVFKIETIGDSYVAVVGLPFKRKRHAVIMAKFAHECRAQMKEVVMELEEPLGEVRYLAVCNSLVPIISIYHRLFLWNCIREPLI